MITAVLDFVRQTIARQCRDIRSDAFILTIVALSGIASLAFASFAAFAWLRGVAGDVAAAAIMAGAYGAIAMLIALVRALRRRRSRHEKEPHVNREAAENGRPSGDRRTDTAEIDTQALLAQAMKLGNELSTMQLLAVALLGGILAGRNIRK